MSTEEKTKSKNYTVIAVVVGFGFIVFILPRFFTPSKNNDKETEEYLQKKSQSSQNIHSYTTTIEVVYTGEYDEVIHLSSGFKFGFVGSSQPYSSKNRKGEEVFGKKGQDIAGYFPTQGDCNTELRFASTNGKSGHLTILIKSK